MPTQLTACVTVREVGDVTVITITQRKVIEDGFILRFGEELLQLHSDRRRMKFVLSLEGVDFCSSAAFGKIMMFETLIAARGGALRLCHIHAEIYEVFAITRLNRLFTIVETVEDALASF